jgi:Ras-related protein Rab-5C
MAEVSIYLRGAHAIVAVYDIRSHKTFLRALKYIDDIMSQAIPPLVVALVGNKEDLNDEREVQYEDALMYAKNNNLIFMETSAKTSTNVDQLFETISEKLIEEVIKRKNDLEMRKKLKLAATQATNNRNKCCFR